MSGKLHLISMKTEGFHAFGFHAKIRCNLNISYLSETQKNNLQISGSQ